MVTHILVIPHPREYLITSDHEIRASCQTWNSPVIYFIFSVNIHTPRDIGSSSEFPKASFYSISVRQRLCEAAFTSYSMRGGSCLRTFLNTIVNIVFLSQPQIVYYRSKTNVNYMFIHKECYLSVSVIWIIFNLPPLQKWYAPLPCR